MAFKFPFSTLHELNLDWILEQVKKFSELIPPMETAVDDVQALQTDVEQAVEDANQALEDANQALETAEEAKEIAEQAAQGTIADGAVTTVKLDDEAVTTAKIADGAVTGAKIAAGTIQAANLDAGCVTTTQILDGTISPNDLGAECVTNSKLGANSVTTTKINDGAVTTAKLDAGAVTNAKIADNAVTPIKIDASSTIYNGQNAGIIEGGSVIAAKDPVAKTVRIYGACRASTTIPANTSFCTIPSDVRPSANVSIPCAIYTSAGLTVGVCTVKTNGEILQSLSGSALGVILTGEYTI